MSTKTSGLGDAFYVGGFDLSGDVNAVSKIATPKDVLDFTTVNKSAYVRQTSLRQGEIDFTAFFDPVTSVSTPSFPATTVAQVSTYNDPVLVTISAGTVTSVVINGTQVGTGDGSYLLPPLGSIAVTYTGSPTWVWTTVGFGYTALSALPRTDTVVSYFRGQAIGNPAASVNAKQVNYDGTRGTDASLTFSVQAMGNAFGLEWGEQLTPGARIDTAATTGTAHDDGAGSSFGGQAYFHLMAFVGTSVTIDIQSATTSGGTYATTGLTTTAMTTVGAQRLATVNTATINEFTKVITTGTFSYAKFAVNFCRNGSAGVVF
jgi:hypothetical protein